MSEAPFQPADLERLDDLLLKASAVVPMRDVAAGLTDERAIGLRHDVDDNPGSLNTALRMAAWEHKRGYRSTYYLLHTAWYWENLDILGACAEALEDMGHEVGLHLNAITEAVETGEDPVSILADALAELRQHVEVTGVVAHGDPACYTHKFVNDELFLESPRPDWGLPQRLIAGTVKLEPVSRAALGLTYDPNWLPRGEYLSDSGGRWSQPFDQIADGFPFVGQLHMLVHPDWWAEAFSAAKVVC